MKTLFFFHMEDRMYKYKKKWFEIVVKSASPMTPENTTMEIEADPQERTDESFLGACWTANVQIIEMYLERIATKEGWKPSYRALREGMQVGFLTNKPEIGTMIGEAMMKEKISFRCRWTIKKICEQGKLNSLENILNLYHRNIEDSPDNEQLEILQAFGPTFLRHIDKGNYHPMIQLLEVNPALFQKLVWMGLNKENAEFVKVLLEQRRECGNITEAAKDSVKVIQDLIGEAEENGKIIRMNGTEVKVGVIIKVIKLLIDGFQLSEDFKLASITTPYDLITENVPLNIIKWYRSHYWNEEYLQQWQVLRNVKMTQADTIEWALKETCEGMVLPQKLELHLFEQVLHNRETLCWYMCNFSLPLPEKMAIGAKELSHICMEMDDRTELLSAVSAEIQAAALRQAIKKRNLKFATKIIQVGPMPLKDKWLLPCAAIKQNDHKTLKWVLEHLKLGKKEILNKRIWDQVVMFGDLETLKIINQVTKNEMRDKDRLLERACTQGHLETIEWFLKNWKNGGETVRKLDLTPVFHMCQLRVLKKLEKSPYQEEFRKNIDTNREKYLKALCTHDQAKTLKWMYENRLYLYERFTLANKMKTDSTASKALIEMCSKEKIELAKEFVYGESVLSGIGGRRVNRRLFSPSSIKRLLKETLTQEAAHPKIATWIESFF